MLSTVLHRLPFAGRQAGQPDQAYAATKAALQTANVRHLPVRCQVLLHQTRIAYTLSRTKRRSIGFEIGPSGLLVRSPFGLSNDQIDQVLQLKADWILRKLQHSRELYVLSAAQKIIWQDGASLPVLGQSLAFRVQIDIRLHSSSVQFLAPSLELQIRLPAAAPQQIRHAVQAWFMVQARHVFVQRLDHFAPLLDVRWSELKLTNAQTLWGSARSDGLIRLNWRLLHFDMAIIDYVVVHELSHLRFMDHSPRFWSTVQSLLPDYALRLAQLKNQLMPIWG